MFLVFRGYFCFSFVEFIGLGVRCGSLEEVWFLGFMGFEWVMDGVRILVGIGYCRNEGRCFRREKSCYIVGICFFFYRCFFVLVMGYFVFFRGLYFE